MGLSYSKKNVNYSNQILSTNEIKYQKLITIHQGPVLGIDIDSENKEIVSCSDDKTIALFSVDRSEQLKPRYCIGHKKAVNKVKLTKDAIWSCSRDLSIRKWSRAENNMVECIEDAHSLNITAITTHEYSQRLYSGSRDYTVKGWDTVTMQSTNSFFAPRNVVTCLTMNNEGSSIYQGSEDLAIRIWDIRANSSKPTDTIQSFVYFPLSLSMHPTNNFLLAVGCKGIDGVGGEIKLFDLRKITMPLEEFLGHRHDITGCTMSSSSNHIISVSKDCTIRGWNYCDTTNGTNNNDCFVVPMVSDTIDKQFTCITEMRSTESAYAGAFDGSICKIDLQKSKESNKRTIEYEEIVEAYNKKDAL